jgi:anti-sigma regulatory factor (Ser/Thr protein kinase)
MEMMHSNSRIIPIGAGDASQAGNARRQALAAAAQMDFDPVRQGQLGIIVTEAANNIATHAGQGEIVLTAWNWEGVAGIDVLALDKGKGILSVSAALQDGFSTAGTPGNGLGAMSRLADTFQIYSAADAGTAVFARVLRAAQEEGQPEAWPMGAIRLSIAGETACGDGWSMSRSPGRSVYIMADGLGHGPMAAEAADEAIRVFHRHASSSPERILAEVHDALAKTRGAAVAVAEILHSRKLVNYAGAGNIVGAICHSGKTRSMVSMNGTVGHTIGRIQALPYPWEENSVLILHSDGLGTRWNVEQYPGLASRHPVLLAGVLFRDFSRRRDDATILVSRI